MDSALGWIGELVRFLASFFPRLLIVPKSHGGVKYVRGAQVRELSPGLRWYWPLVTTVETAPVVRQVLNLPTQLLETSDGIPVAVGGVVEYEINDVVKFLAECENGYEAILSVAQAGVRAAITKTAHGLDPENLDRRIRFAVRRDLRPYGVRVLMARVSDYARVRPVHLTGTPRSQE